MNVKEDFAENSIAMGGWGDGKITKELTSTRELTGGRVCPD